MDNSALLEPLFIEEHGFLRHTNQQSQITALSPPIYQKNKTEEEFSSLKEAINDISAHLEKLLPSYVNIPFSLQEIIPLQDGIHLLATTKEGTILYLDFSAQTFVEKKISDGEFSLLFIEMDSLAYFSKENEILSIKIPSLETSKLWSFEEGKQLLGLKIIFDQKRLFLHFRDEILLLNLLDPNETKTLFSGNFLKFSISHKGQIALINSESQLIAFSNYNDKVGKILIEPGSLKLEYSPKQSMLIIGYEYNIIIFKALNLEKIINIKTGQNRLGTFTITNDEKFLLFPDQENLQFFDLQNFWIRETVKIYSFPIFFVGLSPNSEHVFVSGSNGKFYTLPFPVIDFQKAIEADICEPLDESTLLISNGTTFQTWKFLTNEVTDIVDLEGSYLNIINSENFFTIRDQKLHKVHIPTKSISTVILDKSVYKPTAYSCFSPDGKLLVTGSEKKLFLWDVESMNIIKEFEGHNSWSRCIYYLPFSNALAGIAESKTLRIWDLNTAKEIAFIQESDIIYMMGVTHNEEIIILITEKASINFWDWKKKIRLHSIKSTTPAIGRVVVTKDDRFMIGFSRDGRALFISLETFIPLFSYKYPNMTNMTTKADGDYIYFKKWVEEEIDRGMDWKIIAIVRENPLKASKITFAGQGNKYEYMKYISKLINSKEVKYNQNMDSWVIFPYMINTLHLYAYFNYPNHLKLALKNGSSMINTIFNQNPLSIAIHKEFSKCIDTIITRLDKYLAIHPYSLKSLSTADLVKLNLSSCDSLLKFYYAIFRKDTSKHAAKFCSKSAEIPIHFCSKNIFIENNNFLDEKSLKEKERPITFLSSCVMLDLKEGSQASIDFLYSVYNSPNPSIMMAQLIQEIIHYKWNKLSWVAHIQALFYAIYLLNLSLYILFFIEEKIPLIMLFTLSMILSIYDAYQLWVSSISCSQELWNYIYRARTISSIMYFATYLSPEINYNILLLLVIISWLRGISHFRIFKSTRYMVNLISEVIKDIASFFILLFYSALSFTFILLIIDENGPKFLDFLQMSFKFCAGDFSASGMSSIQWVCFFLVALVNMIVIVNLLISVIGNMFGKVQENYMITDMRELIGMIIEIEALLISNRKVSEPCYFQMCMGSKTDFNTDETSRTILFEKNAKSLQAKTVKTNEEVNFLKASMVTIDKRQEKLTENQIEE